MTTQKPKRPRQKTGIASATPYMLSLYMKDRGDTSCGHRYFYEDDSDGIFRCSICNKIVDPDEKGWEIEDAKQAE